MCKECLGCHYEQYLNTKTNMIQCALFNKEVPNENANNCEEFIPLTELDSDEDIEIHTEYWVHHKCPFCDNEDTLYGVDAEGCEIIECENCGKKYSIGWSLY